MLLPRRVRTKATTAMMRTTRTPRTMSNVLDPDDDEAGAAEVDEDVVLGAVAALVVGAVVAAASRGLVVSVGAAAWSALSGSMMP